MRRVRLLIESADSGTAAAAEVSAIMARLLGWSRRRRAAETRRYAELVEAEQIQGAPATAGGQLPVLTSSGPSGAGLAVTAAASAAAAG